VKDRQDLFILSYFKSCANKESELWLTPKPEHGKILWVRGKAVGFYVANNENLGNREKRPCLRQIYVTPNIGKMATPS
jgi:hypothetical protein